MVEFWKRVMYIRLKTGVPNSGYEYTAYCNFDTEIWGENLDSCYCIMYIYTKYKLQILL